ncbi:hypothetical protein H4684_003403, partial [Desulfomicrobium macestii]
QRRFAPISWSVSAGTGGQFAVESLVSLSGMRIKKYNQQKKAAQAAFFCEFKKKLKSDDIN